MNDLIIPLNINSKEPLYEQIYQYIKEEIKSGSLPFHGRLPSTRALAKHMQVSRSTIDMAYAQLTAEGYLEAVPYKGYFVAQIDELFLSGKQQGKIEKKTETEQISDNVEYIDFKQQQNKRPAFMIFLQGELIYRVFLIIFGGN